MPITLPPAAPSRNNPATFSTLMDAFLAWLVTAVPEFNALALATGPGLFLDGSAGNPGISFASDPDTGLYRPGANQLAAATGGVARLILSSSGMQLDVPMTGSAVVQSMTDATATRLLKVGAGGVLATAPEVITLNSAVAQGFYSYLYTDANIPTAGSGAVTVLRSAAAASFLRQVAHPIAGGQYSRYSTDGGMTWTAWSRFVTLGSLLGTVSQSAGVPTGGVIERGSNANGEYVRFADGTQICTSAQQTVDISTASGSVFTSSAVQTVTMPASFASLSSMTAFVTPTNSENNWGSPRPTAVDTISWRPFRVSSGTGQAFRVTAIGRWF